MNQFSRSKFLCTAFESIYCDVLPTVKAPCNVAPERRLFYSAVLPATKLKIQEHHHE
jgi:hypothetical protein